MSSQRGTALLEPLIALRQVTVMFGYGTPTQSVALKCLDLEVEADDYMTVIGSNGAGKSTLLRVVAGSVAPTSGSVAIAGRDVTTWPDYRRAKHVAHVFQNPLAGTVPELTVEENLSLSLSRSRRRGLRLAVTRGRRNLFVETLAELGIGLERRLRERVGLLSGGQRQALSLVMATIQRPSILLLDEHTAALDPANHDMIMRLTDRLVEAHGLAVVMVTHNMRAAIDHGNRLLMLHEGEIALSLNAEEKRGMTPQALVDRFAQLRGPALDDRIALSLTEPT